MVRGFYKDIERDGESIRTYRAQHQMRYNVCIHVT